MGKVIKNICFVVLVVIIFIVLQSVIFQTSPTQNEVELFLKENSCNPYMEGTDHVTEYQCAYYLRRHTTMVFGKIVNAKFPFFIYTPFHYFNYKSSTNEFHTYVSVNTRDNGRLVYNPVNGLFMGLPEILIQGANKEEDKPVISSKIIEENDKLQWAKMPVSYYITKDVCGIYETNKIRRAFQRVQEATNGAVSFEEIDNLNQSNIYVHCSFLEDCYEKTIDIREDLGVVYYYESICDHTSGIAQIKNIDGNQIIRADIEMIGLAGFSETDRKGMSGFYVGSCGHPTTEIHEILHTFDYNHVNDSTSIMYRSGDIVGYTIQNEGGCLGSDIPIDEWIVKDLIQTYG
jgi:hypothetical protein